MASRLSLNSLPSPSLNNNTAFVIVGKVVGGSSATNGMFFDRGSRFGYDAWDQLQADDHNKHVGKGKGSGRRIRWNWDSIYPYFKKSVTFTPPPVSVATKYNLTWDTSVFGNVTPIHASLPPFQWGDAWVPPHAWEDMGIPAKRECADGNKEGLCWIPISQHPVTARRSYSGIAHYSAVVGSRTNYHLLVRHQVTRLVYPGGELKARPPVIEVRSLQDGRVSTLTAKAEVILSAGAFGTPVILQRSGIGPAEFLRNANIPVVLDLPGVGANLHDHSGPQIRWNCKSSFSSGKPCFSPIRDGQSSLTTQPDTTTPIFPGPMPTDMLDPVFAAQALADFNATPATGPYTIAMSNRAIWISLPNMTLPSQLSSILSQIHSLATTNTTNHSSLYLPDAYSSSPTLLKGYQSQLSVLQTLLSNPRAPSMESAFTTGNTVPAGMLHPFSRGTVRLNLTNPLGPPILDYRSASNPLDMSLHLIHLRYLRKTLDTQTMKSLNAVEVSPGPGIKDEDEEKLVEYIRGNTVQSFMHPCCTAAMMPETHGGVVDTGLRVHGLGGRVRVVDAGVFPVLPSAHLSATVYAVAEKVSFFSAPPFWWLVVGESGEV